MSRYYISNIQPAGEEQLYKGTYILLSGILNIPPHLSLLVDGKVFSLEIRGPRLALPFSVQLKQIRSKKTGCLFVRLNTDLLIHGQAVYSRAVHHTLAFSRLEPGITTCLSPIRNFCADLLNINTEKVHFIYDLLDELEKQQKIAGYFHLNMEPFLLNGSFGLSRYSLADIYESIYRAELTRS
jgi:hypothetical protein